MTFPATVSQASESDAATHFENRILSGKLATRPFPYVIVENVLPPMLLLKVRQHWPDRDAFEPEVPGNYACDPRRLVDDGAPGPQFWRAFTRDVAPVLARAAVARFAEWVIARYGSDFRHVMVGNFSLMQADPAYPGHACHVHHRHDPLWITTCLLYVDEKADGQQGTTIHAIAVPQDEDPVDYASRGPASTIEACTADYKANRIIAFLDSPISYHSVKPARPGAGGARRVLRMHLGAQWSVCESLYGVSYEEYQVRRREAFGDAGVVDWVRRDIAQVWQTSPSLSVSRRRKWASRLSFDF